MPRFGAWALLLGVNPSQAVRVTSHSSNSAEAFAVFEDHAAASGFMSMNASIEKHESSNLCHWTPELQSRFHNERNVGAGATACVYIAERRLDGLRVAIKVAKHSGKLHEWQVACEEMQQIRLASCYAGQEFLHLAEQYMPTCIEVGKSDPAYYVMHAAGTVGIGRSERSGDKGLDLSPDQKKSVYAQFVAGIYALHSVGFAHNDLHGKNVVLDGEELAVIDYSDATPLESAWLGAGLKRDGNSIWRFGGALAGCKHQVMDYLHAYGDAKKAEKEATLLECVKHGFGADSQFMTAFQDVMLACREENVDQKVIQLFQTTWIHQHLPRSAVIYPWEGSNGCLNWDWSKVEKTWEVKECIGIEGAPGQCRIDIYPGACYGGHGNWGCWAPGESFSSSHCRGKGHAGACKYADHGKVLEDSEIETCSSHCSEMCESSDNWGACYLEDPSGVASKNQCLCVGDDDGRPKDKYLKMGCITSAVRGEHNRAYDGLCRLPGRSLTAPPVVNLHHDEPHKHKPFVPIKRVTTTRTTTTVDMSILNSPECTCQMGVSVNGVVTKRAGCHAHLGRNFGKFCYIAGGATCPGARLSSKLGLYWRHC